MTDDHTDTLRFTLYISIYQKEKVQWIEVLLKFIVYSKLWTSWSQTKCVRKEKKKKIEKKIDVDIDFVGQVWIDWIYTGMMVIGERLGFVSNEESDKKRKHTNTHAFSRPPATVAIKTNRIESTTNKQNDGNNDDDDEKDEREKKTVNSLKQKWN